MNVTVMSRKDAVRYCYQKHERDTVMISISDPCMEYGSAPFSTAENRVRHILRLSFHDADRPGLDVYRRSVELSDLMADEDAWAIRELLHRFPHTDVIVHCDAGISRSSGVAAAILKFYTGSDREIFNSRKYLPNMWCYRKTLEALMTAERYLDAKKEETT